MISTYERIPKRAEVCRIDKSSYSEAMIFIQEAGAQVDPDCKAFIGIKTNMGMPLVAKPGDYLVKLDGELFVTSPQIFRSNFRKVKDEQA